MRESVHNDLCESLVEQLTVLGWRVWRLFAPGFRRTSAGISDLVAVRGRRAVWLEVKVGRDSLSLAQAEFFALWSVVEGVECIEVRPETQDATLELMR